MPRHRYQCPHCKLAADTCGPARLVHDCRPPDTTGPKKPTKFVAVTNHPTAEDGACA